MLAVDTVRHRILHNDDLKREIAERARTASGSRGLVSLGEPPAAPSGSNSQATRTAAPTSTNGHVSNSQAARPERGRFAWVGRALPSLPS